MTKIQYTVECMILEMMEVYTMAKIQNAGLLTIAVFQEDVVSRWLQEVCMECRI
jgi:hypothetical protein